MSDPEAYRVLAQPAEAELREKGSRFHAYLAPATCRSTAKDRLAELQNRHVDASHCCFAWRLGDPADERASDAGEPAGTAGQPILRTLRGEDCSDVLAVVVRWFGGTKLGKGGLARAYAGATAAALEEAVFARRVHRLRAEVTLPYGLVGPAQNVLRPPTVQVIDRSYGPRARFTLAVSVADVDRVREALAELGATLRLERDPTHGGPADPY